MCRGLRRAVPVDDGLRVTLGLPGRHFEIIALHADDDPGSVSRLAGTASSAPEPTWLTVPTTRPQSVEETLTAAGLTLVSTPETFMSIQLRQHPTRLPALGEQTGTVVDKKRIKAVTTLPSGEVTASGEMAVTGADAVAHNIRTSPPHRRRGLASVIMTALVQQAIEMGATTGLLVASSEGQQLYASLGWKAHATVLSARSSE